MSPNTASTPSRAAPMRLLSTRGCGSIIVESALALAQVTYEREEADYSSEQGKARLLEFNPLAQVPTLVMSDGSVMTESAAIVLYLSELHPDAGLAPPPGHARRREFLRWLTFLVAAVYPTFTYGDDGQRWVGEHGQLLRTSTNRHRKALWKELEGVVGEPWFLGETFSALDIYLAAMTHWRPRRPWFAENCPRIHAIAERAQAHPRLAPLFAVNFDA